MKSTLCLSFILAVLILPMNIEGSEKNRDSQAGRIISSLLKESGSSGGLVVHAGCGTGEGTMILAGQGNFIVQGLDADSRNIDNARRLASGSGLEGRVTFRKWSGGYLPYTDNLVNVLFWDMPGTPADTAEIFRVLSPGGTSFVNHGSGWEKITREWPGDIDEWPHFRYDAGSTGSSGDQRAGPPNHIQWEAGPRYMRSHEIETGLSSIVSARGRLYYILDEGPTGITDARFPPKWSLVCRDAFNGILLWKKPLPEWGWQAWNRERVNDPNTWLGLRTRPADVDRVMVADGDILYTTLSFGAPVSAIDGATGKILMSYDETSGVTEFIILDGILLAKKENPEPSVTAIRVHDGELLWQRKADIIIDRSLSAAGSRVFFHTRGEMVSLDLRSGNELWSRRTEMRPTAVIAHPEAVLVMQSGVTLALSTLTGEDIWQGPGTGIRGRNPDMFIVDDVVWSGRPDFDARHILTGDVLKKMDLQKVLESGHHRRCYADRATAKYMITGERGSEFLDLTGDDHLRHNWFRGPCITGMIPANGLFYIPPHQCFCYPAIRMDGFFATASSLALTGHDHVAAVLEKGPAFVKAQGLETGKDDWPAYRHNAERSGSVSTDLPENLSTLWNVNVGGNLTQPVISGNNVYVVQKDAGTLHCLDAGTGKSKWSFTSGGRIDSPPVVHNGYVYFGSRDGFVYSLCSTEGKLAWRFHAAPAERQIISYDRLESAWPVHGSVMMLDGILYLSAGRSGFVDGGIYLYGLDPLTGKIIHSNRLEGPFPDISRPSEAFHKDGYRADLLTTDGQYIYMGRTVLDKTLQEFQPEYVRMVGTQRGDNLEYRIMPGMRLVATGTFLNETFWNRTWWMYSKVWPGFHYAQQAPKSGQMIVFNDNSTFTIKHYTIRNRHSPMLFPGNGYLLFADDNNNEPLFYRGEGEPKPIEWEPVLPEETRWTIFQDAAVDKGPGFTRSRPALWTSWIDVRVEAMVLAGDRLFVAGTPDVVPDEDPLAALEGRMGGVLRVVSATDGSSLAEYHLEHGPVYDGMAAAGGRLFLSTGNGNVICMDGPAKTADKPYR